MYNPSVEEIVSVLIESAMEYAMESVDSDLDNGVQLEESSDSVLVNVIKTPVNQWLLPLPMKVKIKLMKIMRDHNIPFDAERELYQCAIKSERLSGFTRSTGSSLIKTCQTVLGKCYKAAT